MPYCNSDNANNTDEVSSVTDKKHIKGVPVTHYDTIFDEKGGIKEIYSMERQRPQKGKGTPASVVKILANWKYIKQNIDPIPLLNELHKRKMLNKKDFDDLGDKRRSHQATIVLLATCKRIQDEEDFQKFKESIRTLSSTSAKQLDLTIQELQSESVGTSNKERDLLEQHRSDFEDKLLPDDLLTILDDFVEKFIFDLNTVEKIIADFPAKKANKRFFDMVLNRLEQGSFTHLITSLRRVRNNKRFQHLTKLPATAVNSGFDATGKLEIDIDGDLTKDIKGDSDIEQDCKELLQMELKDITPGSIIFHLRSIYGGDIPTSDAINRFLERLFKKEKVKSKLLKHVEKVNWRYIAGDNKIKSDTCNLRRRDIICVNRSFLIKEISVSTIVTSFAEKEVDCFKQIKFEDKNLSENAERFIEELQRQPENVIDIFWEILKEHKMTYVLNRLTQCLRVYQSYSSRILSCILDNEHDISDALEFVMIKDTFEERKIFPLGFFDDVEQRFEENEEQIKYALKEILKNGPFAIMTLVDVLYINNHEALAERLLFDSKTENTENTHISDWRPTEKAQLKGTYFLQHLRDERPGNALYSQNVQYSFDDECSDDTWTSQDILIVTSDDECSGDTLEAQDFQIRSHSNAQKRPVTDCSVTSNSSNRTESGYGTDKCVESRTNSTCSNTLDRLSTTSISGDNIEDGESIDG